MNDDVVRVNLWELITTIAGNEDLQNSDKCRAIKALRGPRFGSELDLEINPVTGVWTVRVFDHEDECRKVSVAIAPSGNLTVTRSRETEGINETRSVSF